MTEFGKEFLETVSIVVGGLGGIAILALIIAASTTYLSGISSKNIRQCYLQHAFSNYTVDDLQKLCGKIEND